jgi:hypothetical protein
MAAFLHGWCTIVLSQSSHALWRQRDRRWETPDGRCAQGSLFNTSVIASVEQVARVMESIAADVANSDSRRDPQLRP